MPRPVRVTRKKLIARLDKVFSQWVRSKDADHRGFVQCFTCGVFKHWKTVDAGHFQSRAKFSTRWDEMNVKCQCKFSKGLKIHFVLKSLAHFKNAVHENGCKIILRATAFLKRLGFS